MTDRLERLTDVELLRAARRDGAAFRAFYERYAPRVHRWFARQTGDRETAFDLTAETFACALEGVPRFRALTGDTAAPWVFGIAANLLRGYWKNSRAETSARARLGVLRETTFCIDPASVVVQRSNASKAIADLSEALASLPALHRHATELRVIEELAYSDIADELGCSETAARIRVSRGLKSLRTLLNRGSS
jgi:RNA polymerase sigma-70 factor (ECF subfamily)